MGEEPIFTYDGGILMKFFKSIKKGNIILLLVLVLSFVAVHVVQAVTAEPGSDANPLVSQDYVDAKINEVSAKINDLKAVVDNVNGLILALQKTQAPKFEVLEVEAGKEILLGESAEIILRGGKATAISGAKGGLADLTAGSAIDISTGQNIPLNHLLLSSRNDGRGIKTLSKSWILIKGEYTVK